MACWRVATVDPNLPLSALPPKRSCVSHVMFCVCVVQLSRRVTDLCKGIGRAPITRVRDRCVVWLVRVDVQRKLRTVDARAGRSDDRFSTGQNVPLFSWKRNIKALYD